MIAFWTLLVFVVGLNVGSFLNVAIARLPKDKSLFWPNSRCGSCHRAIRWHDNVPILGYLLLRGRCRSCGATFSVRYLLVELATGLGFVGLFYAELVYNVHGWPTNFPFIRQGWYPSIWWIGYAFHAVLFSLLMAASVTDLERQEIPLPLMLFGTMVGLAGGLLMPWPWPHGAVPVVAAPGQMFPWMEPIREGVQSWPFWWLLPDFCAPGGNVWTGLLTSFVGIVVGTMMLRVIGGVFGFGLGKEALGLGDSDLMMMAGSFLGWQIVVAGFFLAIVPALVFGAINFVVYRENKLPFGPSLAVGLLGAMLGWRWIGPHFQPLFFWWPMLAGLAGFMVVFLFVTSVILGRRSR